MTYTTREVKALLQFVSQDDCRAHLCGVYFRAGSAWATDGHTLVCHGPTPGKGDDLRDAIYVTSADLDRACKVAGALGKIEIAGGARTTIKVTDKAGNVTTIEARDGGGSSPPIGEAIPAYDPDAPKAHHIGVNPEYLARCVKVLATLGDSGEMRLETGPGRLDPIVATMEAAPRHALKPWTVVIMPLRLRSDEPKS